MMKKRNQWAAALMLLGTFSAGIVWGQGSIEAQAQSLFDAKNYKDCVKLLEKELQKPDVSAKMIRLAMNANLRMGNPMSASILATDLLKRAGTKDADALFEAAQAAELAGDRELALSRYLSYLTRMRNNPAARARVFKALSYVMQNGDYAEAVEIYSDLEGRAVAWGNVAWAASNFYDRGEISSYNKLLAYVLKTGGENSYQNMPTVVDRFMWYARARKDKLTKTDARDLVTILTSSVYPKASERHHLFELLASAMDVAELSPREKFMAGRRFVETSGIIPDDSRIFIQPAERYLASCTSDATKARAAKEIADAAPYYAVKETPAGAVLAYISLLTSKKDLFQSVVSPETLAKLVGRHVENSNTVWDDYRHDGLFYNVIRDFYSVTDKDTKNKDKAIAFAKAVLPQANGRMADWLFRNDPDAAKKGGSIDQFLPADKKSSFRQKYVEMEAINGLAAANDEEHFISALQTTLIAKKYVEGDVAEAIRTSRISAANTAAVLEKVIKMQGATPRMERLIDNLLGKGFSGNSKLTALKNIKGAGSDAFCTAAAKALNILDGKDAAALESAVADMLKNMKGKVPPIENQAGSLREYIAAQVYQHHRSLVWGKPENAKKLIEMWAPKMKNGKFMNEMLQKAWELDGAQNRKGGLFYRAAKHALANYAESGVPFHFSDNAGALAEATPAKDESVFSVIPGKMTRVAVDYIFRKENVKNWSKDFLLKQLDALIASRTAVFHRDTFQMLISRMEANDFKYKGQIPEAAVEALLRKIVAGDCEGALVFGEERRAINLIPEANRKSILLKYADMIEKRTNRQKMMSINSIFNLNMPQDAAVAFANKALKPLLDKWDVKDWDNVTVHAYVVTTLFNTQNRKENDAQLKADAAMLLKRLSLAILRGAGTMSRDRIGEFAGPIQPALKTIVKGGSVTAVNRAAIVIGQSIGLGNNYWSVQNTANAVLEDLKDEPAQIQYVFLNAITNGNLEVNAKMKEAFSLKMSSLAKHIPGLVPVEKNDPAYNIFLSQQMKQEGNALQAWGLVRDKLPLLMQRWKEFDFDYVLFVMDQARKSNMYKEAMELGQTMWMDEGKLAPANAAKLGLAKGDVYRDWKSYPAAKIEYESLTTNKRYSKTPAGRQAKFRLIELLVLTQDYSTARTMLERLQASKTQDDQAEAYYWQARVDYEMLDDEAAMDNLREVFDRNSSHPEARLLEGQIMLRSNKLHKLEFEIGQKQLATIAIPGKPIRLLIQDNNLSVIRGGKSLPVLVTTSKGKDREIVELMPNPQDPNVFAAELATCLGKPVPNNMLLELTGDDEIVYQIEPKFQAENGGTDLPPNRLTVRYPAKLYASSQTILSDEEQDELKLLQELELTSGIQGTRSNGSVVRPGSPINVRVVDHDMSLNSNKPDTLTVDVSCSSGDEIKGFVLTETGPTTGVFEGKIETGIPFPNVIVSDALEGLDVNAVINTTKNGTWKSQPDGKRPKWLEIDSMTSCNFKEASIVMPNPEAIRNIRVLGSIDKNSDELAVYPALETGKIRGGLRLHYQNGQLTQLDRLQRRFQAVADEGFGLQRPSFSRDMNQKLRNNNNWINGVISGAFYLPENQQIEFKFTQKPDDDQTLYMLVDDRLLISGRMNATGIATKRSVVLTKGVHTLKIFFTDRSKDSAIQLGVLQPDGSYKPMPADWFSAEKNPALAEYLKPKGKITQTADGFRMVLDKPLRYRRIKWVFEDFNGKQVEVIKAKAIDEKGKIIVPVAQDLTSGKDNQILEIAAADAITVKYEDKKRIDDNKAVLTEQLSSSFFDAKIDFYYENIIVDEEGNTRTDLAKAARATKGDDVIVMVYDPDEDRSDDREIIKADVYTSSGERITLELLEGEQKMGQRGSFRETFRIGDKTDQNRRTLKVIPGDKINARYLDRENNKPGIPFYREAELENNEGARAYLTVFDAQVDMIEDRSPAALAKIQMMRNRQGNRLGDIKLYKEQITVKPILADETKKADEVLVINSKAPLLFELYCPELAKHAKSTAFVDVLTTTEINAADAERRERMPLRVEMKLTQLRHHASSKGYPIRYAKGVSLVRDVLEQGIFSGVVRLQLGSANDEINDLVSSNETFNLLSNENNRLDSDAFKVPTVIVSGSDQVFLSFKDAAGKELAKKTIQLRSDGEQGLYDKAYLSPMNSVHLGQRFYVRVHDPDRDVTAERDNVEVNVKSQLTGDTVKLKLSETLPHSGIFTGSLKVDLKRKPLAGQTTVQKLDANTVWSNFGDKIIFTYVDEIPLHARTPQTITSVGEVVIGSDGELAAFTKKFKDPDMAVKTNFLMAEALFEMAKSHKAIKGIDGKPDPAKAEQAKQEIAKGKRVLEEALRDYPNTSLKAQGEFLLANLAQQLDEYRTAISLFSTVISRYPDSEYAPKSYFQKAVCYEKMAGLEKDAQRQQQLGDLACEEFVRLTYLYPTTSLATDAKLRLGNYYYRTKRYRLAASVLEKFGMAHPEHRLAPKALLLAGYASRRNEELKVKQMKEINRIYKPDYTAAVRIFSAIEERYKDSNPSERAEALYFAGNSLYMMESHENKVKAYQYYQRLIWDYPESKWAKYARGQMAANPIKNIR